MYTLTKEDIKELSKRDTLIPQVSREGVSSIRLLRDDKQTKDGGRTEYQEYVIPVDSHYDLYKHSDNPEGFGSSIYNPVIYRAFAHVSLAYGIGAGLSHILKEGDSITLVWVGGSYSGYLWNLTCNHPNYIGQRLYHDSVSLRVTPKHGKEYSIPLSDSITPANSARMIEYALS
jgi:hypothetical protein